MPFNNMERKEAPSISIRQLFARFGSLPFFVVLGEHVLQRVAWIKFLVPVGDEKRELIIPRALPDTYMGRGKTSLKGEVRIMLESPICEKLEPFVLWIGGEAARNFEIASANFESGLSELDSSMAAALVPHLKLTAEKSKYRVMRVQLFAGSDGLGGQPRISTKFTPFGYLPDSVVENSSVFEDFNSMELRSTPDLASSNFNNLQKHTILPEGQTYVDRGVWYDCRVNVELIKNGYATPEQAFTDPQNIELLMQAHEKYLAQENLMVAATELLS